MGMQWGALTLTDACTFMEDYPSRLVFLHGTTAIKRTTPVSHGSRASCAPTQILQAWSPAILAFVGRLIQARLLKRPHAYKKPLHTITMIPVARSFELMKALLWSTMILGAVTMTACDRRCEYERKQVTAKVSVTAMASGSVTSNCTNEPVSISLDWEDGSHQVTTTDGRHLPRECAASLGFVDGADWNVTLSENTGISGIPIGLVVCEPYIVSLSNLHIGACDAACDEEPRCPAMEPVEKNDCTGPLSCHYGDPVVCPPELGTSTFYDCVDNKWTKIEKANCEACGVSCAPPCDSCSVAAFENPLPPDQITFCNDASAMLYDAFWTCACISGGACEPLCNTSYCSNGAASIECQDCLAKTAPPNGCMDVTNACATDL